MRDIRKILFNLLFTYTLSCVTSYLRKFTKGKPLH
nr:MAG TPA: hypothetical protein [Caudoviricetes sp.]